MNLSDQEAADLKATAQVMTDTRPLTIVIAITGAWTLISALQLVTRHPGLGEPLKQMLENTARQFQEAIVALHPEAADLLERGWDADFDVESGL